MVPLVRDGGAPHPCDARVAVPDLPERAPHQSHRPFGVEPEDAGRVVLTTGSGQDRSSGAEPWTRRQHRSRTCALAAGSRSPDTTAWMLPLTAFQTP